MKSQPKINSTRDAVKYALPYIHGKVLDAGGGSTAKYRSIILSRALEYLCLDGQAGGYVDVVGDVMAMPFENESFDTVICNQVLEHVPDPIKVISESKRVLKNSGHLIFTAPFLEPIHADPGDYFRYTQQGFERMFLDQGLKIIHLQPYGGFFAVMYSFIKFGWFSPYRKLSRLEKTISRLFGTALLFLDRFYEPKIIYSDVFIIAQKI